MIGDYCVIRTHSAGVHCGTVEVINGTAVVLTDARRIWRWTGRLSLSEVSLHGVEPDSVVSEPVARILLTQAIDVTACTPEAARNLKAIKAKKRA